jgi:hypothetical protein
MKLDVLDGADIEFLPHIFVSFIGVLSYFPVFFGIRPNEHSVNLIRAQEQIEERFGISVIKGMFSTDNSYVTHRPIVFRGELCA